MRFELVWALAAAALLVRAADHVARADGSGAGAWRRLRDRLAGAPWIGSAVVAGAGVAWLSLVERVVRSSLVRLADWQHTAITYAEPFVHTAYPAALLVVLAVLGRGPLRRLPMASRPAPYVAALLVPWVVAVARDLPWVLSEGRAGWLVGSVLDPASLVWLVPPAAALLVPERQRGARVTAVVLLLATVAVPLSPHVRAAGPRPANVPLSSLASLVPRALVVALLFHRVATLRTRSATLLVWTLVAGVVSALVLVGVDVDWTNPMAPRDGFIGIPSWARPNQLRVVVPVVLGWLAALVPLLFARGLEGAGTTAEAGGRPRVLCATDRR